MGLDALYRTSYCKTIEMMKLQLIKHNDILFRDLLRAVTVKNVAWPHPVDSQLKWIIDNMHPDDLYVFLKENGEDLAYMTLSTVTASVNGVDTPFKGVGCVCSAHPGMGGQIVDVQSRRNNSKN